MEDRHDRVIVHIDLDCFYAQVLTLLRDIWDIFSDILDIFRDIYAFFLGYLGNFKVIFQGYILTDIENIFSDI